MWGYSSNSRKNLIYGIVIVILIALLGVLLWTNKVNEDKKSVEFQALNQKFFQEEQEKQAVLKHQKAEDSFYQKLEDGFDVNVLIVGDSIGAGSGTQMNVNIPKT